MRAYTERQTDERTHAHTAQDCWQPQRRPLLQSVGFAWNCVTYHIRGVGLRSIPCRCYLFSCSHTSFFPASPYRPPAEASVTVELQLPSGRKSHAAYGALDLRHGARGPVTQGMPCVKHVSLFFSPSLAACSLALQACINAMRRLFSTTHRVIFPPPCALPSHVGYAPRGPRTMPLLSALACAQSPFSVRS